MSDSEHKSEFDIALEQYPAPEPGLPAELELIRALEETGATFPDMPRATGIIERWFDDKSDLRTCAYFQHVLAKLRGTKAGRVLARVLSGDRTPLRDAAKHVGISYQAISKSVQIIKKRLHS